MVIGGGEPVDADRVLEILGDAGCGAAGPVVVGNPHQRIDHNTQPVLVGFIGIEPVSDTAEIGECLGVVAGHATPQAVHVAQIPIGDDVAVFGRALEEFSGAFEIALLIGPLGLLEIVGPERDKIEIGRLDVGSGREVGIEIRSEIGDRVGGEHR